MYNQKMCIFIQELYNVCSSTAPAAYIGIAALVRIVQYAASDVVCIVLVKLGDRLSLDFRLD